MSGGSSEGQCPDQRLACCERKPAARPADRELDPRCGPLRTTSSGKAGWRANYLEDHPSRGLWNLKPRRWVNREETFALYPAVAGHP